MIKARTRKAQKTLENMTEFQKQAVIDHYFDFGYDATRQEFNLSRDVLDSLIE